MVEGIKTKFVCSQCARGLTQSLPRTLVGIGVTDGVGGESPPGKPNVKTGPPLSDISMFILLVQQNKF